MKMIDSFIFIVSFKIYDFDEDDKIGEDDLMTMLAGANDFNDLKVTPCLLFLILITHCFLVAFS
jgi:hypothetical protein